MNAHDLMSTDVVTVAPETPLRDVAKTLLRHRISAVPVVDDGGALVGIVSEGDLVGRKKTERETRSEWWLMHLAEGEPLNNEYLAHLQSPLAVAREIMSSPVIAVSEDTPMDDIATLMGAHRVKRLPVLRDGHLVGVVRRADLLRTIGGGIFAPVPRPLEPRPDQIASIHHQFGGAETNGARPFQPAPAMTCLDEDITADDLRLLVAHRRQELDAERARRRAEAAEQRRRDLHRLIETHVTDKRWDTLIHGAREAAERGETEFLMLRFPSQLCSDGGRAINAPDPDWPKTLRGEAAELYLRWERELRPRHFHIAARVLEFPGGVPGDIGLFLCWGV
jgi:CBS domain-containing protein